MKFLLIRHTSTDWNVQGRIQGHVDIPLCDFGREQARALRKKLLHYSFHRIVTSDLSRARQTGAILNEGLNVPSLADARLRECAFGKLEGMKREEIIAAHGEDMKRHLYHFDDYDFSSFGGERRDGVWQRQCELLNELKTFYPDETMALVGHGRSLKTLLAGSGHEPVLERGDILEFIW